MTSFYLIFTILLTNALLLRLHASDSTKPEGEEKTPDLTHDPLAMKQNEKDQHEHHQRQHEDFQSEGDGSFETPDSKLYKHIRDQLGHLQGDALVNELKKLVAMIDTNKDNRLDKTELMDWAMTEGEKGASQTMLDPVIWKEFDRNNDSLVSFKEIVSSIGVNASQSETQFEALKFKLADANNDSLLSREEMVQFMEPHYFRKMTKYVARETMEAYDGNKDGKVTKEEFMTSVGSSPHEGDHDEAEHFAHLDRDGNQVLDEQEIQNLMSDYGISSIASAQVSRMLEIADTDNDSQLTIDEIFSHPTIFLESGVESHEDSNEESEHPDLPKDEVNLGHGNEDENDDSENGHNSRDEL